MNNLNPIEDHGTEIVPYVHDELRDEDTVFLDEAEHYVRARLDNITKSAVEVGAMLIKVKSRVGHGNYLGWLKRCFPGSERTAQIWVYTAQVVADYPMATSQLSGSVLNRIERARKQGEAILSQAENEGRSLSDDEVTRGLSSKPDSCPPAAEPVDVAEGSSEPHVTPDPNDVSKAKALADELRAMPDTISVVIDYLRALNAAGRSLDDGIAMLS